MIRSKLRKDNLDAWLVASSLIYWPMMLALFLFVPVVHDILGGLLVLATWGIWVGLTMELFGRVNHEPVSP